MADDMTEKALDGGADLITKTALSATTLAPPSTTFLLHTSPSAIWNGIVEGVVFDVPWPSRGCWSQVVEGNTVLRDTLKPKPEFVLNHVLHS